MIGLAGLIDSLLTAKGSPPLDVRALQNTSGVVAPGPVRSVVAAGNDVRLPSHAALDRLIPDAPVDLATPPARHTSAQADLSLAARAISVVLAQLHGDASPVRGTAPVWPTAQTPLPAMLAGALAQTVSDSGLFYESHLAQLAEGTRSLAQMLREPQASWPSAWRGAPLSSSALAVPTAPTAPTTPAAPTTATTPAAVDAAHAPGVVDGDAMRLQEAYRWGAAPPHALPGGGAQENPSDARPATSATSAAANGTSAANGGPVIHPQGMTLVHQQLDLLATEAFRWSGHAWPGVPMDWSIEAQPEPRDGEAAEATPRSWSTTVSLQLVHLGQVDVHLNLGTQGLQARLSAGEAVTATHLRAQGAALVKRLDAAGLRLQEFQVAAKEHA